MRAFIARQPIFDKKRRLNSYELLYRDSKLENEATITDSDYATKQVLSDAITLFGLRKITEGKRAFINFTDDLILEGFPTLGNPRDIVIEILEDAEITDALVYKIRELRQMGYVFALDDYTGDSRFDPLIPYVDIIKLDLSLTTLKQQVRITRNLRKRVVLLAEKVETEEEFNRMVELGCELFQGYYLGKPDIIEKNIPGISKEMLLYLMSELDKDTVDYTRCAKLIKDEPSLAERMSVRLEQIDFLSRLNADFIAQALMIMGKKESKKWVELMSVRGEEPGF